MDRRVSLFSGVLWVLSSLVITLGLFYAGKRAVLFYHTKKLGYPLTWLIHAEIKRLPSGYIEELLDLSVDKPVMLVDFDAKWAQKKLQMSPFIKRAYVEKIPTCGLYIDYVVRVPVAYIQEYENMVVDMDGYVFPLYPFITPKKLPTVSVGGWHFTSWNEPIRTQEFLLAQSVLALIGDEPVEHIDVSHAYEGSCGRREIIITLLGTQPILLRLGTKNYVEGWACYKQLKTAMQMSYEKQRVIDLRIPDLGFISS